MPRILLATRDGLHTFDDEGLQVRVEHTGRAVTSLAPQGNDVWAIVEGSELWQAADEDRRTHGAGAGGLAVSSDRGLSWTVRSQGLAAPYSRAVAVCGDAVLVSASNGPRGGQSAVYRGDLGGPSDGSDLERCRTGLPEWFDDNVDS